jgi:uncharacterized protein YjiS (DUF1127 family)
MLSQDVLAATRPVRRSFLNRWIRMERALERWRQRRLLLTLSGRALKDMGISRCDAEREAARRWRR